MQQSGTHAFLFTDLYELTMAQAYWKEQRQETAVFELFFRALPGSRSYMVAAGLSDVLSYLENLRPTPDELDYLRKSGRFSEDFLNHLQDFRFHGDVHAVPEGTVVFPHEPLVQVVAPILEAQLIETFLINQVHFQSLVASKAARVLASAQGRLVFEFGSRRAHGTDAALKVAKVFHLMGANGTSNVQAGQIHGIPIFGTMAHSYIQSHAHEIDAFRNFVHMYPGTTLLVDTYDTLEAIRKVITLSREWPQPFPVHAVRLDSGDLEQLARESRRLLDEAGLQHIQIFASGDLDEYKIHELLGQGAPIDGFGVGTRLAAVVDTPVMDMVYKLVEFAGQPRTKLSPGKVLYPGRKQIFRSMRSGHMAEDIIGLAHEELPGQKMLQAFMIQGKRTALGQEPWEKQRARIRADLSTLPCGLQNLSPTGPGYPIHISEAIQAELKRLKSQS